MGEAEFEHHLKHMDSSTAESEKDYERFLERRNISGSANSPAETAHLAAKLARYYYEQAHRKAYGFDPLHDWDQFCAVIVVVLFVLGVVYCRGRIQQCIFGDSKLHIDRFYLQYFFFFKCCGLCEGEWTRAISRYCCCCNRRLQGRNLSRAFGEYLGISPVTVRVSNVVLGDLPRESSAWFPSKPDVFLQIIADELQPTLNTEIIPEANANCVQFTTSLTLLLKDNINEKPVSFVAKKMRLAGSTDLADAFVPPARVIAWARAGQRVRVQMGGASRRDDPLCHPWILMDLSVPIEKDILDREASGHGKVVSLQNANRTNRNAGDDVLGHEDSMCGLPLCGTNSSRATGDLPMDDVITSRILDQNEFKDKYPLRNGKGKLVREPDKDTAREQTLVFKAHTRRLRHISLLVILGYLVMRAWTINCWDKYVNLESVWLYAQNEKWKMPLNDSDYEIAQGKVWDHCHDYWYSLLHPYQRLRKESQNTFDTTKHAKHVDYCNPESVGLSGHGDHKHSCKDLLEDLSSPTIWYLWTPVEVERLCPPVTCQSGDIMRVLDGLFIIIVLVLISMGLCWDWEYRRLVYNDLTSIGGETPGSTNRDLQIGSRLRPGGEETNAYVPRL